MISIFDLNFKLSKSEILEQLITSTDLVIDNPVLVDSIINDLGDKNISVKFACSVDSETNELIGLNIVSVDDNLIIKNSGLVLKRGYVVKSDE